VDRARRMSDCVIGPLDEVASKENKQRMKKTLILIAVAALAAGCDQQRTARNEQATDGEKDTVQKSVKEAKAEVDKQARAQKDILDAEAKAAQAKIDAEQARAKAAATDAQAKVEAASQTIRDAAGSASTKAQTESATIKSTETAPAPVEASDTDQKMVEQVKAALGTGVGTEAAADVKAIQVTASGGTVTLSGNVKTEAEKTRLESAAKAVPGVTKVENKLEVKAE
jgi:osmotically-inducible protein OsmY